MLNPNRQMELNDKKSRSNMNKYIISKYNLNLYETHIRRRKQIRISYFTCINAAKVLIIFNIFFSSHPKCVAPPANLEAPAPFLLYLLTCRAVYIEYTGVWLPKLIPSILISFPGLCRRGNMLYRSLKKRIVYKRDGF